MANFLCDFLPEHLCDDQIEVDKDGFVEKKSVKLRISCEKYKKTVPKITFLMKKCC